MNQVIVYKGRTVVLQVALGVDVSQDEFASEIRVDKTSTSDFIAAWTISFATDGTDGELLLTLDDSVTAAITQTVGYMDIKRTIGGEPTPVYDDPVEVLFKDVITV